MLRPLLVSWYACAKEVGVGELSAKLLFEMIVYGVYYDYMLPLPLPTLGTFRGEARY